MNANAILLLLVFSASSAACVEVNDPCGELKGATPIIELGTGQFEYEPLENGGLLEVDSGPQGGFHVYGSMHASGFYPGPQEEIDSYLNESQGSGGLARLNPQASYSLVDQEGNVMAEGELNTVQQPLIPDGDVDSRSGDIVFLLQGTKAEDLEAKVVDFSVSVKDLCGGEASDQVTGLQVMLP